MLSIIINDINQLLSMKTTYIHVPEGNENTFYFNISANPLEN